MYTSDKRDGLSKEGSGISIASGPHCQ